MVSPGWVGKTPESTLYPRDILQGSHIEGRQVGLGRVARGRNPDAAEEGFNLFHGIGTSIGCGSGSRLGDGRGGRGVVVGGGEGVNAGEIEEGFGGTVVAQMARLTRSTIRWRDLMEENAEESL